MNKTSEPWIGVIGAGQMGSGIALLCARQGYPVHLIDTDQNALDRARSHLQGLLEREVHKGKLTPENGQATWARLHLSLEFEDLREVGGVIEAVPEQEDLKGKIFRLISTLAPASSWIATNTSSLSVTKLASFVTHPDRFMGVHFFNPPLVMPLVELIRTPSTAPECFQRVREFVQSLNKTTLESADTPGFIVNRVLLRMVREAVRAWEDGVATIATIDQALQSGARHPMGPLSLADFIGIDVCIHILKTFHQAWPHQDYAPPRILEAMMQRQWLGAKTGLGFYDYTLTPVQARDDVLRQIIAEV